MAVMAGSPPSVMGTGGGVGAAGFPTIRDLYTGPPPTTHMGPLQMLQMRMRWAQFSQPFSQQGSYVEPSPFDHVEVYQGRKDFIVLLIIDGEPVILRDSHELFPSDTLITQLKLVEGK